MGDPSETVAPRPDLIPLGIGEARASALASSFRPGQADRSPWALTSARVLLLCELIEADRAEARAPRR